MRATRAAAADVGAPGLAAGDGQHPLDGGRVRRVVLALGAATSGRPGGRGPGGAAARAAGVGGVEAAASRASSVVARGGRPGGRARDDVALGDVVEQRHQLVAHPVAAMDGVGVGGVVDGRRGPRPRTRPRSRPGAGRGGDGAPARMPARPSRPAPRRRLSRTVSAWSSAVWPVRTSGGQHRVAGGPGPGLEVGAGRDVDRLGPEGGAERAAASRRRRPRRPSRAAGRGRRGRR